MRTSVIAWTWGTLVLASVWLAGPGTAAVRAQSGRDEAAARLVAASLGARTESPPAPGRGLFEAVLDGEAFVARDVGPFRVRVRVADALGKPKAAEKVADAAAKGLAPAAALLERRFGRADGLVSGRRIPVVIVESRLEKGETAFLECLALLDRCEDGGYSGFKPGNAVFGTANLSQGVFRTWEVVLVNLASAEVSSDEKGFLAHGLGYHALNLVSDLLLKLGAFGPVPPWLQQGLADELDIEAYGEAFVAAGESTTWSVHRDGWFRAGWEGFVPQGQLPPPPVFGPPAGLSSKMEVEVTRDAWMTRSESRSRHWTALAADRRTAAPASLRSMAAGRSFTPRDRAYARLVLNLVLATAEASPPAPVAGTDPAPSAARGDLLEALDHRPPPVKGGLRGGAPLPVIAARALGGLPGVDAIEAMTLEEFLASIERGETIERIRELGAARMLALKDHREMSAWLYGFRCDDRTRLALFNLIVDCENLQQLREWEVLGAALDRATDAALQAGGRAYPKDPQKLAAVVAAFHGALGG